MNSDLGLSNLQNSALQIGIYSLIIIFLIITVYILFFTVIPAIRRMFNKSGNTGKSAAGSKKKDTDIPAGDSAAIAAAIFLFMDEIHDNENRVVTIKRVSRTYSPWNSKIYGVNWLRNR